MKSISKLLFVFVLMLLTITVVGCESMSGPEGKYAYTYMYVEKASLTFEKKKVTFVKNGEEVGTFDYEYTKSEEEKYNGTVTFKVEEKVYTFEFNYEEKKLKGNVFDDGTICTFKKTGN